MSTTPPIKCSAVSTTQLTNLLAVSLTPAINLCHGFSLIGGATVLLIPAINFAGDNDTDDKFFIGINDTGEQLSPVTTALAVNFSLVSTSLVNNYRR